MTKYKISSKEFIVDLSGQSHRVKVTKRSNSRRITMRPNHKDRRFDISIPYIISYDKALDFFKRNNDWVQKHQMKDVAEPKFASLNEISFMGQLFSITYTLALKPRIKLDLPGQKIAVFYTQEENIEKQMTTFLKKHAKAYFYELSLKKAQAIGVRFAKVLVGDSKSKWGSCSSKGNLRYNFRLIMAPSFVTDYLIAHEVAHLREFNHKPAFWDLVEQLSPYTEEAKSWLKESGRELY